jgi:hypothetical protein
VVTFSDILEENENNNLPMSGIDPKFLQNMRPNSLLSVTGQQVEKVTLKTVQNHKDVRFMLSVSFVSRASQHDTPMYCSASRDDGTASTIFHP